MKKINPNVLWTVEKYNCIKQYKGNFTFRSDGSDNGLFPNRIQ